MVHTDLCKGLRALFFRGVSPEFVVIPWKSTKHVAERCHSETELEWTQSSRVIQEQAGQSGIVGRQQVWYGPPDLFALNM